MLMAGAVVTLKTQVPSLADVFEVCRNDTVPHWKGIVSGSRKSTAAFYVCSCSLFENQCIGDIEPLALARA